MDGVDVGGWVGRGTEKAGSEYQTPREQEGSLDKVTRVTSTSGARRLTAQRDRRLEGGNVTPFDDDDDDDALGPPELDDPPPLAFLARSAKCATVEYGACFVAIGML